MNEDNPLQTTSAVNISFIHKLQNKITKKKINCSKIHRFKYFELITKQLANVYGSPSTFNNGTKITTKYINQHIVKNHQYIKEDKSEGRYLRIKFISGQLYLSKYQKSLSYRFAWWLYYFMRLFEKYGSFIPDTDFIIYMGDTGDLHIDYDKFPFFVGDGIEIKNKSMNGISIDQLPLYTMPRSYIWIHQSPVEGYADILCYRDSEKYKKFEDKLDKAIFRGAATGGDWRTSKRGQVIVPSIDENITEIDAAFSCWKPHKKKRKQIPDKYCTEFMDTPSQMKYKYVLLMDGNSVRDAYPKQLGIGSLLLKQKSIFKEFWYYDLINYHHIIHWIDFNHLKKIIFNLTNHIVGVDKQKQIAANGRGFVDNYLTDECMDCFIIHMIQLYNHYFFDNTSVTLSSYDILINKTTIKPMMNKGYKSHIYDFKYFCPVNNLSIVSQKYE